MYLLQGQSIPDSDIIDRCFCELPIGIGIKIAYLVILFSLAMLLALPNTNPLAVCEAAAMLSL